MHESPTPYWMWHLTLSLFFIFILSPEKRVPDDKVFLAWGDGFYFVYPWLWLGSSRPSFLTVADWSFFSTLLDKAEECSHFIDLARGKPGERD